MNLNVKLHLWRQLADQTHCGETGSLKMHWSRLYGCNTRTKCCELMPEMLPASMEAADARVSESITKNKTRAFSLARCSNSIRSGVHSDTCCGYSETQSIKFRKRLLQPDSIQCYLPDYRMKCSIDSVEVWRHRPSTSLDCTIPPKILLVLGCHRTESVLILMLWLLIVSTKMVAPIPIDPPATYEFPIEVLEFGIASNRRPIHRIRRT